jgi:hypothetical protein
MEKIALIMGDSARNLVISPRSIKRMEQIGEVVFGTGSDRESVKKALAGASAFFADSLSARCFVEIILQKIGLFLLRLDAIERKARGGEMDVKPRYVILGKPLEAVLGADAIDVGGPA